jgi:hypothetical protein
MQVVVVVAVKQLVALVVLAVLVVAVQVRLLQQTQLGTIHILMAYYAQIVNDLVTDVIVVNDDIQTAHNSRTTYLVAYGLKHLLTLQAKIMQVSATHTTQ